MGLSAATLLGLTGCLGGLDGSDEILGRWSVAPASCVNPLDFKPLGRVSMNMPSMGSLDANWSRSNGVVSVRKAVIGNALLGVNVKLDLSEPKDNQMTIKSASITGAGGVDLSNFLSSYNKLYKCK